jgi:hypothetical protein
MGDIDVAPMLFEILRYETAVAMVRLGLAAQQATVRDRLSGTKLSRPFFQTQRRDVNE